MPIAKKIYSFTEGDQYFQATCPGCNHATDTIWVAATSEREAVAESACGKAVCADCLVRNQLDNARVFVPDYVPEEVDAENKTLRNMLHDVNAKCDRQKEVLTDIAAFQGDPGEAWGDAEWNEAVTELRHQAQQVLK